jgi:diguanylate cyclase (GGDEF)-like protein
MGQGMAGWVAQNVQPIINANPAVDPGFSCKVERPLHSALALPLEGTQGVLGVIALYRRENDAFTRDELRILTAVTPKIATAVENALKYKEAEIRANIDGLTGLPNAHLMLQSLEAELARAHRFKQSLAVVVCQLAGHQQIVEDFGQAAGDLLLRTVAKGLRSAFRDYDHVGRIGEATFALVLPGMKPEALVSKLGTMDDIAGEACERLGRGIAHFMIGEAFYPDDGDGARQLLSLAERRLSINAQRQTADLAALNTVVEETQTRSHPVRT